MRLTQRGEMVVALLIGAGFGIITGLCYILTVG